jgi:hypothetical protein
MEYLGRDDFECWVDHEDEHFRSLERIRDTYVPKGIKNDDLINGMMWLHRAETNSIILKYRRKLGVLFKSVKSIHVFYLKNSDLPSILFNSLDEDQENYLSAMNVKFGNNIESIENIEPNSDGWKRVFSIDGEWLFDGELHYQMKTIDKVFR